MYDPIYISNPQRQNVLRWLPGAGGVSASCGAGSVLQDAKHSVGDGHGRTAMGMSLMPQNSALNNG